MLNTSNRIKSLTWEQAIHLHTELCIFLSKNVTDVFDYGLMDNVLLNEYQLGVKKLTEERELMSDQKENLRKGLDALLTNAITCAEENISIGRFYYVYINFLTTVATTIDSLQHAKK